MTEFIDGPAAGKILELRRAPVFLRVVRGHKGNWDALDQLGDASGRDEDVYAYRREANAGMNRVHYDFTDRQGCRRGRTLAIASYRFLSPQPHRAILRDNAAWQAWAREQWARAKEPPCP